MKLFFLFLLLFFLLRFSNFKLSIENFVITNTKNIENKDFKIKIQFYILGFLKLFSVNLNNQKIKKKYSENILKKIEYNKLKDIFTLKELKKFEIEKFNLVGSIGINDIVLTTQIIVIISSFISILVSKKMKKKYMKNFYYNIIPNFKNDIIYYFQINCILKLKIANIINILRRIKEEKNGTSNRKSYEYSHE